MEFLDVLSVSESLLWFLSVCRVGWGNMGLEWDWGGAGRGGVG